MTGFYNFMSELLQHNLIKHLNEKDTSNESIGTFGDDLSRWISHHSLTGCHVFRDDGACADNRALAEVIPGRIIAPPPTQALLPIVTGFAISIP